MKKKVLAVLTAMLTFLSIFALLTHVGAQEESADEVAPFTIDVSAAEVSRGSAVSVTFTRDAYDPAVFPESYNDWEYGINLWHNSEDGESLDFNWDWRFISDWTPDGSGHETREALIFTAGLPEGNDYGISGSCWYPGFSGYETDDQGGQQFTLHINEAKMPDNGFIFMVNQQTDEVHLTTNEEFMISAFASGADWIDVFFDWDDNRGWNAHWDGDSFVNCRRDYSHAGTYHLVAQAWYPDFDGNGDPVMGIDEDGAEYHVHHSVETSMMVYVDAPNGSLSFGNIDTPASISTGDGLEITIPMPESAEYMNASICVDEWDWQSNEPLWDEIDRTQGDSLTLVLPAGYLQDCGVAEGDTLRIEAYASAYGYDAADYVIKIPVINNINDTAVIFFEDPSFEDEANIPVNQDIQISVCLNGNDDIKAVRFFDGYGLRGDEEPDEDGVYRSGQSFGSSGSYSLYAMVTFDDWNEEWDGTDTDEREWVFTNVLRVNVESYGVTGPFEISLNSESITRGDTLEVTFTAAGSATNYWLDLWDDIEENNDIFHRYDWDYAWAGDWQEYGAPGQMARTMIISTAALPEGTYHIQGKANALGYEESRSNTVDLHVDEMEGRPDVLFVVDRTEAVTGEDITYSAFAPGADRLIIYQDYENGDWNQECDRDRFAKPVSYSRAGTYTLIACAVYGDEENEEYRFSDPVTVKISAPNGLLSFDEVVTPDFLVEEDSLAFTVWKPNGAKNLEVSVRVEGWDGDIFYDQIDQQDNQDSIAVNMSAENLSEHGVCTGDVIHIHANARGFGYDETDYDRKIPVVGHDSGQAVITFDEDVNMDSEGIGHALVNEDAHVTVRSTDEREIKTIRFYGGYDFWQDEGPNDGNEFHAGVSFGEAGVFSLLAMVTFDDWDDAWDGTDYDGREWVFTNVLKVEIGSNGVTEPFSIQLDRDTVTRGEKIRVTMSISGNATNYWLDGDLGGDWWYWVDEEARVAEFTTVNLEPGSYIIGASAGAPGLENVSSNHVRFTVLPKETSEAQFVIWPDEGEDLLLNQNMRVELYAPGARRVGFALDGSMWHFDENGKYCWGDGESWSDYSNVRWENEGEAGQHSLTAFAQYDDEEEWVVVGEKTVNVVSYGRLSFDTSTLPAYLIEGEDAQFSVRLPEYAETMNVQLHRDYRVGPEDEWDDGWRRDELAEWREWREGELAIDLSGTDLIDGEFIQIDFQAEGIGYERTEEGRRIPIVAASGTGAELSIETHILAEGRVSILKDEDVRWRVTPLEGNEITAVRFFDGLGWWEEGGEITRENHDEWFDGESFFAWTAYHEKGTFSVYAKVQLNGSSEWITTNVITVDSYSNGQTGPFDFTDPGDVTVTRGQLAYFSFTQSENADNYWVEAFGTDDGYSWQPDTFCDGNVVAMATSSLHVGEYDVRGRAGGYGLDWTESDSVVRLTVAEPSDNEVHLELDRTELLTNEGVFVSVYAPGALRIGFEIDGWRQDLEDGEGDYQWGETGESWNCYWENFAGSEPGTIVARACAQYEGNDEWVYSDPVNVTVTAPRGQAAMNTDSIPAFIVAGDGAAFSVPWPEGEDVWYLGYDLRLDGEELDHRDNTEGDEAGVYFEPHSLSAGQHVQFAVWAGGRGYEHNHIEFHIPVVDDVDDLATLVLPGNLVTIGEGAFEGGRFERVIVPEGCESIGPRAFANCEKLVIIQIPDSVTYIAGDAFEGSWNVRVERDG